MIIIKKADKTHIPQLKSLWKICFEDTSEYIDFFFENRFETCTCMAATDANDSILGAMYLMNIRVCEYNVEKDGFYIYAIGVYPELRGKGIYKKMHDCLAENLKAQNMFAILSPANNKLCEYYKTLGFIENSYVSEVPVLSGQYRRHCYVEEELTAGDFFNMRNEYFDNPIIWDMISLEYVLKENTLCGGRNILLKDASNNRYYVLMRDNTIIESNVPAEHRESITSYLCKYTSSEAIVWVSEAARDAKQILRGMSYNLKKDEYFLNLILN